MKTAIFIDFDDSFSYNVIQELLEIGLKVNVLHWKDLEEMPKETLLVLGPGPGHPDDYQSIYPIIQEWLQKERPFFGICLGHQIFWRLQGEDIVRSKEPIHGQKISLTLNKKWQEWFKVKGDIWVQRYNSLCVPGQAAIRNPFFQNLIQGDEILITQGKNILTYQFHPESLGTTHCKAFFFPVLRLIV